MDFSDTLKDFLSNMVGNVEKAIIKVIDNGENDDLGMDDEIRLEPGNDVGSGLRNQLANAYVGSDVLRKAAISELAQLHKQTEELFAKGKQFTVQFNPSTLRLRASGGGMSEIRNFTRSVEVKEENQIGYSYQPVPFSIYMDVDLIFNKVDPNDAFIELAPSLATIKGAAKSVFNLLGKNSSYSVQNEIEGLIATTRCFNTCMLSFNWGKLCYSGVLQHLESNYSVFNPKGEPVAGTVHLSMILIDEDNNERNMGKWYKAYQEAFQEGTKVSTLASLGRSAFTNFTF